MNQKILCADPIYKNIGSFGNQIFDISRVCEKRLIANVDALSCNFFGDKLLKRAIVAARGQYSCCHLISDAMKIIQFCYLSKVSAGRD